MTKIKPRFFSDTKFLAIAKKYNKSAAQLALRYLVRIKFVKFTEVSCDEFTLEQPNSIQNLRNHRREALK